jgi:soluble lytic murein transglycosylase-like protein
MSASIATASQFSEIAREHEISPYLLESIAYIESSYNPYAIHLQSHEQLGDDLRANKIKYTYYNDRGRNHYQVQPETLHEAQWIVREILPKCIAYDIGMFQISNGKMIDNSIQPEQLLDAEYSASWASTLLRECYLKEGSLWTTVECYHRGMYKGELTTYAEKVYDIYWKLVSGEYQSRF